MDVSGGSLCNGVSEQRSVFLVSESHGQQVVSVLQGFRERGVLFDFSIRVQDETLPCHRCVLAASSDFFRAMFELDMRERDDGTVTLSNLSPQAVHTFLDFAYSGEIEIREDNVDMLFQLASFLQVGFLSRACSDFLVQTLDVSNCLPLLALAEGYGSSRLLRRATEFVTQNFHALSSSPDFLEMPVRVLERCLSSDALNVPDEESVLHALLRWTRHHPQTRESLLRELLPRVRLHHLRPAALEEAEQLLSADGRCISMIKEALVRVQRFSGMFCDARPSTISSYIFVHKTEDNGENSHAFCYNVGADRWTELPHDATQILDLPGSALTSFGEKLFIIGGCRGDCHRTIRLHIASPEHDATDEVWCYCPVARSFTPALRMRHPRTMHASVAALNRIYVIGGKTHGACSVLDVEYFDPLSRVWTSVSALPRGIYFPEASACGSVIYTLGSEVEITEAFNPSLDCFFRYDAVADQWCQLVAEFGQFFHATLVKSVSINNTLYLCDLSTYKVYSFCPDTCVWKGEGSFECAGFNAGAIGVRDKIYILGGDYSPDEITDEVQVYDSGRSEWQEVSPMPRALTEFHCQVLSFNRYRDPWRRGTAETP
ncbi:kelch repeat and BTB domain-containing 3 [Labeo rohita]|uniref:Kelch repeat and BTB domain-containing 3 n=1 Tax=Labeo rohita TaxID=84645 RepID=A0A498M7H0_LABRO|nr:kelch repeat and BTB domain-containing protein 3 [Labeo rohita]XP_050985965.1 kelch repeat and BTB domain-containing protein 3 [Labeo rohita]XP_050985966.1 kelch repeat and BTB domain-containing protein 3 [Labeo rohita]XP_050985967.1 kelch repeat and BTB domain-containing protein 3 [Labeo rohita]RXN02426.1 kelch repeat and BTB domain-containing 3 [Labeo rohita]RXN16869.1 kelch repeat and BTB domain-containing 3 [Labeo rohita]